MLGSGPRCRGFKSRRARSVGSRPRLIQPMLIEEDAITPAQRYLRALHSMIDHSTNGTEHGSTRSVARTVAKDTSIIDGGLGLAWTSGNRRGALGTDIGGTVVGHSDRPVSVNGAFVIAIEAVERRLPRWRTLDSWSGGSHTRSYPPNADNDVDLPSGTQLIAGSISDGRSVNTERDRRD